MADSAQAGQPSGGYGHGIEHVQRGFGMQQPFRHGAAHLAEADKSDLAPFSHRALPSVK